MKNLMIIAGLVRRSGTGKQSGKPYDFWTATVLQPTRIGGITAEAHGFESSEISVEPAVVAALKGGKFPIQVECNLALDRNNKAFIETVIPSTAKAA